MATIKNAITMQDRMSPVLNKIFKSMQNNLKLMDKMDKASNKGITGKAFKQAQKDINSANNALTNMQNNLRKSKKEADGLSNSMSSISKSSSGLGLLKANALLNIGQQIGSVVSGATNYLDRMSLVKSRIDLINDGTQTTAELQEKVLLSADRARMSYGTMLDNVAKLNLLAKDQFSSNDEAIAFVETLNKMFVVSGTAAEEATSATYQLNQAMAAGKLQGDEFRSVMENAPMLADAIAKETGKSKGELKELSSEGLITADIIKNAMFNFADEVEDKFSKMPMTFGQKMQQVSNNLMKKLEPVSNKFSEWLNSDKGSKFFDGLVDGVTILANVAMVALEGISKGIGWVQDNIQYLFPFIVALGVTMVSSAVISAAAWTIAHWPLLLIISIIGLVIGIAMSMGYTFSDVFNWIAEKVNFVVGIIKSLMPVILGIGAAILVWWLAPFIITAATFISLIPIMIADLWAMIPPIIAQAMSWLAVNWPILLVAVAIGILIFILAQLGVTFDQVIGFIVGLLYSLVAIAYNVVVGIINPFIILANFIGNLFIDPIGAIKMLFLDMAEYVVDKIMWVVKALQGLINLIPGVEVNMTEGLENIKNMILKTKAEVQAETGVKEAKQLEFKDVGESFGKGYKTGSDFVNNFGSGLGGLKDLVNKDKFNPSGLTLPDASSFAKPSSEIDKVGEVGKIKGDVSITDEDVKLLKDIAATKFINSYTTLRPEMKVEFTGDIKETADVNKILEAIEDMAEQAIANTIVEEAL